MPASLSAARCVFERFQIACSKTMPCSSGRRPLIEAHAARASTSCSTRAAHTAPDRPRRQVGRGCGQPARSHSAPGRPRHARARLPSSGVANSAAAATWSSDNAPASAASSAGRLRSAPPVTVMRTAERWSLPESCASHARSTSTPRHANHHRRRPRARARDPCLDPCLLRDRARPAHADAPHDAAHAELINRQFQGGEHTFEHTLADTRTC